MKFRIHPIAKYALLVVYVGLICTTAFLAPERTHWQTLFLLTTVATALLIFLHRVADFKLTLVIAVAVGFRLFFLPLPPSLSDDAYRYIWDGAVSASGTNPYKFKPSDSEVDAFQADPIYEVLNSKAYHTVYPPVSQFIFWIGGQFYDSDWQASYYAIKLLLMLMEVAALLLLARMIAPAWLMLYAWHPLVLLETAGQAHTESAMLFFLTAFIWFIRKQRGALASIALAFAGWVKLYPFVFFPFLWRKYRWMGLVPGGIMAALLLMPFYYADFFSNIASSLNLYVRFFEFNAGVYYGVKQFFLWYTGDDWSKTLGPFFRTVFLLSLPLVYLMDYWKRWSIEKSLLIVLGLFLICSTTIHPWYFLGILLLSTFIKPFPWHWYWVATLSIGTYLLYIDGPYWPIVTAGWLGWLLLGAYYHRAKPQLWFQDLQQARAARKAAHLTALLPEPDCGGKVLDLGAGEGYVGAHLAVRWQADVKLADVCDMNCTTLPHTLYDGRRLPFADRSFDITVLYFVLHHTEDPEHVLREALRVTRGRVMIVESVYEANWDLRLLTFLDVWANRLRSMGRMNDQEEFLQFKKAPEWKQLIEMLGGSVIGEHRKGAWVHKQHSFVVDVQDKRPSFT